MLYDAWWWVRDSVGNALTEIGWWCIIAGFACSGYNLRNYLAGRVEHDTE